MRVLATILLLALCSTAVLAGEVVEHQEVQLSESDIAAMFKSFLSKFKLSFSAAQIPARLATFTKSAKAILAHNALFKAAKAKYEMGVTRFAALTDKEFKKFLGVRVPGGGGGGGGVFAEGAADAETEMYVDAALSESQEADFASGFDWKSRNVLLSPRYQGDCGSCWAFSAAATIEAALAIQGGAKAYISPQAMVNCAGPAGCGGCDGAFATCVYKFSAQTGYFTEKAVPYTAKKAACGSAVAAGKIKSHTKVAGSAGSFSDAIKINPLWVALQADALKLYKSGVLSGNTTAASCAGEVNHAVVAVGFGTDAKSGLKFFNIRNSWGADWGEAGHFRISADGGSKGFCNLMAWGGYYPVLPSK